ncbi:MAG: cobaltochelatase subunit CobN [Peptococcaceae bacterium]|jgi:cobaltochelatase CobN|nr:cobaltochelatase subunit CobN [Peptococcaceae bacterium]MDH7524940.1 cobaltochelatase subunit CobN [Peptococcaceae bacterium]
MSFKVIYLTSIENDIHTLVQAVNRIKEEHGPVVRVYARAKSDLADEDNIVRLLNEVREAGLVIFNLMGGKESLPGFDRVVKEALKNGVPLHAQPSSAENSQELRKISTVSAQDYSLAQRYIHYGGTENFINLLLWAANRFGGLALAAAEPKMLPWEGIYHPRFPAGIDQTSYWRQNCLLNRIAVGIAFYRSHWIAENTLFVDALIEALEKRDVNVVPVFLHAVRDAELGTKGLEWVIENYFMQGGRPVIDVLVSLLSFSPFTGLGHKIKESSTDNCLLELGVPVIKAITSMNNYQEWSGSIQGLGPLDVSMSVAMPEFDGTLITVPVATREYGERDASTGAAPVCYKPVPERVDKVAGLAVNWGKLRHKPNAEKKIAIIFHNYPPRNDRIGCAFGLDSAASVWNILKDLQKAGYVLESLPENGQELMEQIINRVTNDRRWASAEQMAGLAVDGVTPQEYGAWFERLPPEVREKMNSDWGRAPGEVFNYGGRLLIPGIINGNVFIGLQPPRGFGEDPAKIYHSPDASPTHHYLAYYRWIRDDFKADAVLHIGKHGSLEWLPGKSVGLSASCYPDLAITDLPHIYPYIINNPGEGTQAKRRSYACIIDHLVPVMTNADSYDEMAEIEVQLEDYYQAKTLDPDKLPHFKKLIWEKVVQANLDKDLAVDKQTALQDFDGFLEKLHGYLSEIKDTQIRDGLHILGEPPRDGRLVEMLVALTRLANGPVPSLRQAVAEALGYDYEDLLAKRGRLIPAAGRTCGQILDEINAVVMKMMEELHQKNFCPEEIPAICRQYLNKTAAPVEEALRYAATTLVKKLGETTAELSNILNALAGGYTPPGPSGAPTRGMADILPTGRNFYSVDPQAIPSPAAWKTGVALGDALLERYLADEGRYPESIGIIVWGSPTMRTKGDDIAEILYLMGVKPVWEEKSGRVKGLGIIPLDELNRPRIDVTMRISGFFRDAFPNIVALLDEAVEMVARLEERDDENYLAKHVRQEIEENVKAGLDEKTARELAGFRIFGCRPGAYGAGVSNVIEAKNWQDEKDLGQVYVTWGGYAYGRKVYGKTVPEVFKKRLSRLDLAVKNEDTREHDILDSDDFYSYHGGMVAAVKAFKGALPRAYSGDSSDPDRVKMRSTAEETKHVFRSRVLNPKWIASMQRHGYKGAGDMSALVDNIFGLDATAEVMEDWMYERLARTYALDPKMQEWFKKVNPYALQNITERLLEAIKRGMWEASPEMAEELKEIYLDVEGELEAPTGH